MIEFANSTSCKNPKYIGKRIQTFENRVGKPCTGLSPSTSQHILNVLSGAMPISQNALFCTAKDLIKVTIMNPSFFQKVISPSDIVCCGYKYCYQKLFLIFGKVNSIPLCNFLTNKCSVVVNIFQSIFTSK